MLVCSLPLPVPMYSKSDHSSILVTGQVRLLPSPHLKLVRSPLVVRLVGSLPGRLSRSAGRVRPRAAATNQQKSPGRKRSAGAGAGRHTAQSGRLPAPEGPGLILWQLYDWTAGRARPRPAETRLCRSRRPVRPDGETR